MNLFHPYTLFPLGDAALLIDFGNAIDSEINKKVLHLFHQLKNERLPYIVDLIPAYSSLTICYDVVAIYKNPVDKTAFEIMAELIETITAKKQQVIYRNEQIIEIPVCYASQFALDMQELADAKNLTPDEIIKIHTSKIYRVYMIGFLPGFAYMGEVDEQIAFPRKQKPRTKVAAGSVGIAGAQTGIYPLNSPGGWQIIGQTPVQLFTREAVNPVLFNPGDSIKFYSISEDEFAHYQSRYS